MNNEETILDPQYTTDSNANKQNAEPKAVDVNNASDKKEVKKNNGISAKMASGAVGVAAGVAGTMYADDIKAAIMPEAEEVDESQAEQQATEEKPESKHEQATKHSAPKDETPHDSGSDNGSNTTAPQEDTVKVVDVRYADVDGDGKVDTVVQLDNGVHLVDTNGDGEADIAMADLNGNRQLDEGEYADVSDKHIVMPTGEARPIPANQTHSGVEVVDVRQADIDGDGNVDTVAFLKVDGDKIALVDTDNDGEANYGVKDLNQNGTIEDNEIVDVTAEHIAMPNANSGATIASNPNTGANDGEVHVLHVGQADLNNDGYAENVAVLDIEGHEVLLVDIDQEGTADVMIADVNNDGQREVVDISDDNIVMPGMSDGDMYMAGADSEPDYMNDADMGLYEA